MTRAPGVDEAQEEDCDDHLYLKKTSRKYTKPVDMIQNGDAEIEENDVESAGPLRKLHMRRRLSHLEKSEGFQPTYFN